METERGNENINAIEHNGAGQLIPLAEVAPSQRTSATETLTSLEINEYAPANRGEYSLEVPRERVRIDKTIGQGAYGQVAKGKVLQLQGREERTVVAIKMLKGTTFRLSGNTFQ